MDDGNFIKKNGLKIVLIGMAILGLSTVAKAQVMTETLPTQTVSASGPWSQDLNFATFDSSLGTLTKVDFIISGSFQGSGVVTVTNPSSGSITATTIQLSSISLQDTVALQVLADGNTYAANAVSAPSTPTSKTFTNPTAGQFVDISTTSQGLISQTLSTTDSGDLSNFTGNGSNTVGLSLISGATISYFQFGNGLYGLSNDPSGLDSTVNVTVQYEYTPVPEGSTWSMVIAGFGMLVFLKRFRPRKH